MNPGGNTQRISPAAYAALGDALASIYWWKSSYGKFLRLALSDSPELLNGLDIQGSSKRQNSDILIERLAQNEHKYQAKTISLMVHISKMESFPELEKHEDPKWLDQAHRCVGELRKFTDSYRELSERHARYAEQLAEQARKSEITRVHNQSLEALKQDFIGLHNEGDPHYRGRKFESFLNDWFALFDLYPKASYSLAREQIDGAFSFDTDDYILEAKWTSTPIAREALDVFVQKISRKGKNALGLFVSVNGFTNSALGEYSARSPFITIDGHDIFLMLEGRIEMEEALFKKKRRVNETGSCFFPVREMIG